ncbi:stress-responsive transcription factor hsf1 [Pseudogymnoascus destructans]|uniref:HSF-type DNA-binding domain-containing protein n=2 Tax=Pseudogymnoascus destructans TaxID=655981 RepID=L8GDI5_PSED2|nr:stress-responsive transcription factor hsf1 [Pseudogymnoascus destructans]ELR10161.1 hypothetical protein GMDG_04555 [Pseudogymnoascus destructans 20631-21]OAF62399.1 stress-responsive transcription factor hsf1 [Pseudogymnoascus destructans]
MTAWMPPPVNTRKRPAPGASPVPNLAMQNQPFPPPQQAPNEQYMRWNQGAADNAVFSDMNFGMAPYGTNGVSNAPFQQAQSTQLARRPMNQHLVPTASRTQFDNSNECGLTEELFDPNAQIGGHAENDSIERLEERAQVAKREAQAKRKQIPPFVQKLNSFVDDAKNDELIRWSERGDSFVVLDEDEFAKNLIPELFKHNNYASFVRQLNMYGFHKRVGLSDNSMKASERKNKSPSEYYNPYFKRGHPNLLWLINKPKTPQKKSKGGQTKQEDGGAEESDDDNRDGVEETFSGGYEHPNTVRALSAAPDNGQSGGTVALTVVQKQLRDIQQQQGSISSMIARLRKEHNDLYSQAVAFQTLHDRHESSINAILTFLATVYNRSLDGQGGPNITQMFANSQDQHHSGSVVDLGNVNSGQPNASPIRHQQRLIMPPPSADGTSTTQSTVSTGNYRLTSRPGAIEELFEPSTTNSPPLKPESSSPATNNIIELINSTNANAPQNRDMAFPDALHHYENSNGASPLSPAQRADVLRAMASNSAPGMDALAPPLAPPQSLAQMGYTDSELEELARMQRQQDGRIEEVENMLSPLTPRLGGGPEPGADAYFGDATQGSNLDLDMYLDPGAYYGDPATGDVGGGVFGGGYGDAFADGGLDFGDTGTGTEVKDDGAGDGNEGSPKRRRKQ